MDASSAFSGAAEPRPDAPPSPASYEVGYEVGYGRPPAGRPFRPGVSGNPMGRPRRPGLGAAARQAVAAEPTQLEQALGQPVVSLAVDAAAPVPLARAVVARLTERALGDGDVAACRELLRLVAEAEAVAAERALFAAEQADARAEAQAAETAAREAEAAEAAARAQRRAHRELERLAAIAAGSVGAAELDAGAAAVVMLGGGEAEDGELVEIRQWAIEAAQTHDPDVLADEAARPLQSQPAEDALERLGVTRNYGAVASWFVAAARARAPDRTLSRAEQALLALARDDGDGDGQAVDWVARLGEVDGLQLPLPVVSGTPAT